MELRGLGIGIESGDVAGASEAELAEIFARFHTVVSCVGFAAGQGIQLKLALTALSAVVKRYLPWQFGVDYDAICRGSPQDLFDEQLDVRDLLRGQQGTEWLIVSTGMFTSFLFEPAFGVVDLRHGVVHALGDWSTEVTVTTAEDIGRLTARIMFTRPEIVDQVVYLAGDTRSYRQLADLVDGVLATEVRRVARPTAVLLDELAHDPNDTMKKYRAVFAQGRGVAWDPSTTFNAQHDVDTTTAAQWAGAHLVS